MPGTPQKKRHFITRQARSARCGRKANRATRRRRQVFKGTLLHDECTYLVTNRCTKPSKNEEKQTKNKTPASAHLTRLQLPRCTIARAESRVLALTCSCAWHANINCTFSVYFRSSTFDRRFRVQPHSADRDCYRDKKDTKRQTRAAAPTAGYTCNNNSKRKVAQKARAALERDADRSNVHFSASSARDDSSSMCRPFLVLSSAPEHAAVLAQSTVRSATHEGNNAGRQVTNDANAHNTARAPRRETRQSAGDCFGEK